MLNLFSKGIVSRLVLIAAMTIGLAACQSTGVSNIRADITAEAQSTPEQYRTLAEGSEGETRLNWKILELKALVNAQRYTEAETLLVWLSNQALSPVQMAEWQLARADIKYGQGDYDNALAGLNFPDWWQLNDNQYRSYHEMRAKLLAQSTELLPALRARVALSQYLPEDQQAVNWDALWQRLMQEPVENLQALTYEPTDGVLKGWVDLAIIRHQFIRRPVSLQRALAEWTEAHPTHPAIQFMPVELATLADIEIVRPQSIALLLPLSGQFASQAEVIRDGFLQAMLDDQDRDPQMTVKIYDVTSTPLTDIYQQLLLDNIDFVVGPLLKDKVFEFERINNGKLPMLALNEPSDVKATGDVCYLALSPEQEAAQAATYLHDHGFQYPLIFAPNNALGERSSEAFSAQWKTLAETPTVIQYFGTMKEMQQQINQVLGLNESANRISQMRQLTRRGLESEKRSRRDIDAIYMVASPAELAMLKPFIRVAINPEAKQPGMYASSRGHATNIDPQQLNEIKGIIFSDIPMLIEGNSSYDAYQSLWPGQSAGMVRLHALGMDSYTLAVELPQMKALQGYTVPGQSGLLSIDNQCVVQRKLDWAIYTGTGIAPVEAQQSQPAAQ
ncbi:Penicillin-binding protein activator LpoA [Vibrio stylophorae]|uniref:Penicillin-binding protein activator LpoA n=1 Tax=Vibrio stylophorae TaxID=659351 RepID=A0ABN8DN20_9VIBR|nr:penicillin-binding protein activator [Vibrio stylophorae]CAH0532524.1 Penicillin-binding protein activator LpoA [Vibrio stylophorae]